MGLLVQIHYNHWRMCGVNGENGECGANYEESFPHFRNSELCSSYIEPLKVLLKFTTCHLVIHAFRLWKTILKLDGLVTHGRILFMHTMLLLDFFPRETLWTWSSHG